jgi:hypothetical protein
LRDRVRGDPVDVHVKCEGLGFQSPTLLKATLLTSNDSIKSEIEAGYCAPGVVSEIFGRLRPGATESGTTNANTKYSGSSVLVLETTHRIEPPLHVEGNVSTSVEIPSAR